MKLTSSKVQGKNYKCSYEAQTQKTGNIQEKQGKQKRIQKVGATELKHLKQKQQDCKLNITEREHTCDLQIWSNNPYHLLYIRQDHEWVAWNIHKLRVGPTTLYAYGWCFTTYSPLVKQSKNEAVHHKKHMNTNGF